ncbi:MAG: alpha/beta fold hydrolase [Planctomycetota bacterium]
MKLRRPGRRSAKVVAVLLIAATAVAGGVAYRAAGQLLAPCPKTIGGVPEDFPAEEVAFASESGSTIRGWCQSGEPGRGVVVLLHGIRSDRRASVPRAKLIAEAGFSTLLIDLRCHGESAREDGDEFIGLGHLERHDVRAAAEFAKRWRPGEPIGVVGFSLGGAATVLASPLGVDAVVLEAVFPTIDAAVDNRTERYGVLGPLASWALRVQLKPRTGVSTKDLRPVDKIDELGCPVLIVGGGKDRHTTPDDTRQLFGAAAEPKELVWFEDLAHNNYAHREPKHYRDKVVGFLRRHLNAED